MRRLLTLCTGLVALTAAGTAQAGPVLKHVLDSKTVRCVAVERPGLALEQGGKWQGLTVDFCKAIAVAVLGPKGKVEFDEVESPKQFAAIAKGEQDVAFLTAAEMISEKLTSKLIPGPAVFYQTHQVMVLADSPYQRVADLAGQRICVWNGTGPANSIERFFEGQKAEFIRMAHSEEGEMIDAYMVRNCHAIVHESTKLGEMAGYRGVGKVGHRLLPDLLATVPVMATTSVRDPQWSAIVAWAVHTVITADHPESAWRGSGPRTLPLDLRELGLAKDWQANVVAAVGTYADIYKRNLGAESPLKLPRGPNAIAAEGGLFAAPFVE